MYGATNEGRSRARGRTRRCEEHLRPAVCHTVAPHLSSPGSRIPGSVYLHPPLKAHSDRGSRGRTMRVHPRRETMTKRASVRVNPGGHVGPHRSLLVFCPVIVGPTAIRRIKRPRKELGIKLRSCVALAAPVHVYTLRS